MEPTLVVSILNAMGKGAYVPAVLSVIGAASAVATVYPNNWKGAAFVHKLALLIGKATPANPAA